MNKVPEFSLFVSYHNFDVLCMTETWIGADVPDGLFCPSGVQCLSLQQAN